MKKFHTIVIGGGSAGLVCSYVLASMGVNVALAEKENMGGDCLNTGCVPSKTLIKIANYAHKIKMAERLGINTEIKGIDINTVTKHIAEIIAEIKPHDSEERYSKLGVTCLSGEAKIIDKNMVSVGGEKYKTKYIVIATGSTALIPSIKGLDLVKYYTNENVFNIESIPEKLIVLGAGAIGLELGQSFARLGSNVTIVDMAPALFMKDDREVGSIMYKELSKEVELSLESKIIEIKKDREEIAVVVECRGEAKTIRGDSLLVALGRKPVTEGLNLDDIGVKKDSRGFVVTDKTLKTNVKNIYACGDVVGPFQFTHMAGYQGGLVARNIVIPFRVKANYSLVPWNTYTNPEVAHVGYTEEMAKKEGLFVESVLYPTEDIDRNIIEECKSGFVKLIVGKKGRIIGATMLGNRAGEMIPFLTLAIKNKMKTVCFASLIFAYPSETEVFRYMASEQLVKRVKPWMKTLLKKLFIRE